MNDEGWEARMAERTRAQRQGHEDVAARANADADVVRSVEVPWLNGWARMGATSALIGADICCIGCGRVQGITTVAIPDNWVAPDEPVWPFTPEGCPVCWYERWRP
jgi:hypothetical protein